MRWSLRCKSEGLPAAAARYSASSSVIRSLQKKACGRPSGRLPTCLWHAGAGYKSRVRLIRLGWCSSTAANTKMLRLSGVACAAIGSSAMCRTDIGRRPRVCRTMSRANAQAQCRRHRQPPCAQSFLAPEKRSKRAAPPSATCPNTHAPDSHRNAIQ